MIQKFGFHEELYRLKTQHNETCIICNNISHNLTDGNYGCGFVCYNKKCWKIAKSENVCLKCNNGIHVFSRFEWFTDNKRKHQQEFVCKLCNKTITVNIWQQDQHCRAYYEKIKYNRQKNNIYQIKIRKTISGKYRHFILQKFHYRCSDCGASKDETTLHIDHIKPFSKGGSNELDNLQVLCKKCNLSKHTDEWVGGE